MPGYAPPQRPQAVPPQYRTPAPDDPRARHDDSAFDDDGRLAALREEYRRSGRRDNRVGGSPPPRRPDNYRPQREPAPEPPKKKRSRFARRPRLTFLRVLLVVVLVVIVGSAGLLFYFDSKLHRVNALSAYPGRVGDTPGTNWLLVGSDSRSGLSAEQKKDLSTGDVEGVEGRTDTIMLVHIPRSGKAMLVSIPRDLYVPIPGQGQHKINAAFSLGGASLLVQTVESATRVHIDHYAEIGFGGFDSLVDAVGGVKMCLDQPLHDPKAGLDLPAGCQTLNGRQALGLVRTRAFPNADLERVVNQRKFLSALVSKAMSPSTILNPFKFWPFVSGAVSSLTVDNGDHIWHLGYLGWKLHSDPITTTTPTGGPIQTDDGDSLAFGDNTTRFFDYIARDQTVPSDLLSTGGGAVN